MLHPRVPVLRHFSVVKLSKANVNGVDNQRKSSMTTSYTLEINASVISKYDVELEQYLVQGCLCVTAAPMLEVHLRISPRR